jgi:alkaline phosphatase D
MTPTTNRRTWLHIALAQAAGLLVPGAGAESAVVFDADPFKLGVASGHPTENSVVLWTRLIPVNPLRNPWDGMNVPITWELATDESFTTLVQKGQALAPSELAHSVHIEVQNLQSDRVYYYRFLAGNFFSQVGRTRTFPASNASNTHLRFAFASCQRYHEGNFTAYTHMLADAPDVVVFLGDYIYEMGATQQERRGTWLYPVRNLVDYRELYDLAHSDLALRQMRAACPWIVTWDDHEVVNDYAGAAVRAGKETARVTRLMPLGYQAWYENMPVSPRTLVGGEPGLIKGTTEVKIYEKYTWGKLADLHLLDNRQYRSKQVACGLAGAFDTKDCQGLDDPQRSMLGATQEKWLLDNLARAGQASPNAVTWNCIL